MTAIIELLAALVAALVEATIHLIAACFSAGFLASRSRGMARVCYLAACALALYLVFGIARLFVPALATPGISPLYNGWYVLIAIGLLLFTLVLGSALRVVHREDAPFSTHISGDSVHLLSIALAIAVVFGGMSLVSSQRHHETLGEKACRELAERAGEDRVALARRATEIAQRMTGRQLSRLPCVPDAAAGDA